MKIELLSADPTQAMSEIADCVRLQKEVGWGDETVPSHVFRADSINVVDASIDLGYVLIAKGAGGVEGFARVTTTKDPKVHWLHEIVVGPHSQSKNLGFQIMNKVREESLCRGAQSLLFTYDPIEAHNGNLYLTKCRAEAPKVYENLYGNLGSKAHANRMSHRLLVHWEFKKAPITIPDIGDVPEVLELSDITSDFIKVEVPFRIQMLSAEDSSEWQKRVYPVLVHAINALRYRAVYLHADKLTERAHLVLAR